MNEISDKELTRTRLRFLDLIKSFFVSSPDAERFSRWRGTFAALAKEKITPEIDQHISILNNLLAEKKLEDLADEYYTLFIDPFSGNLINLTGSHHIDGRNHGNTLISIRQFLFDTNIHLDPSVKQPEDSLPVMLDILATLVEQNKENDSLLDQQKELISGYLLPSLELINKEAEANPSALFYKACISFCNGYIILEKSLVN